MIFFFGIQLYHFYKKPTSVFARQLKYIGILREVGERSIERKRKERETTGLPYGGNEEMSERKG